jgi:hypothetical protein
MVLNDLEKSLNLTLWYVRTLLHVVLHTFSGEMSFHGLKMEVRTSHTSPQNLGMHLTRNSCENAISHFPIEQRTGSSWCLDWQRTSYSERAIYASEKQDAIFGILFNCCPSKQTTRPSPLLDWEMANYILSGRNGTTELYLIYLEIVLQYLVSQKCVTKNMADFCQIYVILTSQST